MPAVAGHRVACQSPVTGNEYAKRQAARAGIGFVPLDNAFAAVDDVAAVQTICDDLDEEKITALAARLRVGGMRGPESRTLGPIGTVGRYRLAKELTHCWLD